MYAIGRNRCTELDIRLVDSGDEYVLDDGAITFPIFAVLNRTVPEVASAVMDEHGDEEHGVEVGNDGRACY